MNTSIIARLLRAMGHSVFARPDGYVRHDFPWYGFGFARRGWYWGRGEGWYVWMNVYRRAPLSFPFIIVGLGHLLLGYSASGERRFKWSGSAVMPWQQWVLRLGRFYIVGNTPKALRSFLRNRRERQWAQEEI